MRQQNSSLPSTLVMPKVTNSPSFSIAFYSIIAYYRHAQDDLRPLKDDPWQVNMKF